MRLGQSVRVLVGRHTDQESGLRPVFLRVLNGMAITTSGDTLEDLIKAHQISKTAITRFCTTNGLPLSRSAPCLTSCPDPL